MRIPLVVVLIILAIVIGGVAGFLYAASPAGKALMVQLFPEAEPLVGEPAPPAATNPFEATQVNPLDNVGYENPFEQVRTNPFE